MKNPYQHLVDQSIADSISSFGPKNRLRDAVEYALKNGGKRFRPMIVHIVSEALGSQFDITDAALAVEYFHTASLIADDLPCMDDDDFRREVPSLHKAFDEATAVLASYALIAAGYERIRLNAAKLKNPQICSLAIENASLNTGILGATGGQYFDLFPHELNREDAIPILEKKTATLFEISFVFGWLFGGGDLRRLPEVKQISAHFGLAFQISDDFLDWERDQREGALNYVSLVGSQKAAHTLFEELAQLKSFLKSLQLEHPGLLALVQLIESRAQEGIQATVAG